jgi:hypothetical protein
MRISVIRYQYYSYFCIFPGDFENFPIVALSGGYRVTSQNRSAES